MPKRIVSVPYTALNRWSRIVIKRFPPVLAMVGAALLLWAWQSETANLLERLWLWIIVTSGCASVWGYVLARNTADWVRERQRRNPAQNYDTAQYIAQTHKVSHLNLVLVQACLLAFGLFAAFSPQATPARTFNKVQIALTVAFFLMEGILTHQNFYLIYRRERLVAEVRDRGGD